MSSFLMDSGSIKVVSLGDSVGELWLGSIRVGCTVRLEPETTGGGFLTRERTFLMKEFERANGEVNGLLLGLGWSRKGDDSALRVT